MNEIKSYAVRVTWSDDLGRTLDYPFYFSTDENQIDFLTIVIRQILLRSGRNNINVVYEEQR